MTHVSDNLVNDPAVAAALAPPHFHVLTGLPGLYMPDDNIAVATREEARAIVAETDDDGRREVYRDADLAQWSNADYDGAAADIETAVTECYESECMTCPDCYDDYTCVEHDA